MYGPGAFCKLLVRDVETVCMHVSGLQLDDSRSTPAALMRSAHPVLSKIAACLKEQPARKTGFRMLVQPISSSLLRSFANQRWWYSPLKTVCLRRGALRNITGFAAEQRLDDSRVLVGQCDRSAIVSASGDHLLQPDTMELSKNKFYKLTCPDSMKGWMRTKLGSQRSSSH